MKKILAAYLFTLVLAFYSPAAKACTKCGGCAEYTSGCSRLSKTQSDETIKHISEEWMSHRKDFMIKLFWEQKLLPALMLMTEQLSVAALNQVQIIGTFFDAKHQLETQRLFQEMAAQAHKDYHPSEGMCTFGTNVRSLAASDRNTEFTAAVIATRGMTRQLLQADGLSGETDYSDENSRFAQFVQTYCNPDDNAHGLDLLCGGGGTRPNKDIDYTATLDAPMTLNIDFAPTMSPAQAAAAAAGNAPAPSSASPDEEDIFALAANLYANDLPNAIGKTHLYVNEDDSPSRGANLLLDIRSIAAKRSVAYNSFAAIAAQKAQGEKEVQPYLAALLKEMGVPDDDITKMLGDRPSYWAQMEVLTKKLYQSPNFYTDLYDKPTNVKRKEVAMQAIDLMQKRDMFRSLLRSEANLSVILETVLMDQQRILQSQIDPGGGR